MLKDLPKLVQQEVQYHLDNQDHEAAQLVHDQWMMKNHHKTTNDKDLHKAAEPSDLHDLF